MKITQSAVEMKSSHSAITSSSKQETLQMWVGNRRPSFNTNLLNGHKDTVSLSDEGRQLLRKLKQESKLKSNETDPSKTIDFKLSDEDKRKIHMLEELLSQLTGRKVKFASVDEMDIQESSPSIQIINNANQPKRVGWGIDYQLHEQYHEEEQMTFAASGVIKTEDGRTIDFSLIQSMSREYTTSTDISLKAGDALIDPLVINFDGSAPSLTAQKYDFDLNHDGKMDHISFVSGGSGFLALDKNGDGKINDGSELFGPNAGNGFSELSQYDSDGNQWIDENDAIFDQLKIWTKDQDGNDQLVGIGEKGIGAIYVGNISSAFDIKNMDNQLQGQVKSSGVFVKENGQVGTVQQIDLVI